jgi:MYXO-CTERM domain-containing protein
VIGTGHDGELWNADGVELMLDPARDQSATPDADDRHLIVTAAGDVLEARGAGAGEDRSFVIGAATAATMQAGGYRVLVAVPWSGIGVAPAPGMVIGADLALNDLDGAQLTSADWAVVTPFAQPARWNAIMLSAATAAGTPSDGVGGNGAGGSDGTGGLGAAPGATHGGCGVGGDGDGGTPWLVLVVLLALVRRRQRSA